MLVLLCYPWRMPHLVCCGVERAVIFLSASLSFYCYSLDLFFIYLFIYAFMCLYLAACILIWLIGFGTTARSTNECRKLEPNAIVVFHQTDVGEYLREEQTLV